MSSVNGIGGAGSVQQIISLRQQIIDRSSLLQELHQAKGSEMICWTDPAPPIPLTLLIPCLPWQARLHGTKRGDSARCAR